MTGDRPILLAAGGTGGHLFPAEALASELGKRGVPVELATDERATRYGRDFPARATHVIPSATVSGGNLLRSLTAGLRLAWGCTQAFGVLGRVRPRAVVGFGGYPTIPPVLAAVARHVPTVIHEQNNVMGRANRFLSSRVSAIATSFPGALKDDSPLSSKRTWTGNPVRPAVIAAAAIPYEVLEGEGSLRILIFGGSQGARVMSDIVPAAVELMAPALRARVELIQQARDEDVPMLKARYAELGMQPEIAPFFADLPARMAAAHLIISRSGASTVAELAAIGRPSILVPLPHALDHDQMANAGVLADVGGALRLQQADFTPERLAAEIAALATDAARLTAMAKAARSVGALDAAQRLADLVLRVAERSPQSQGPAHETAA